MEAMIAPVLLIAFNRPDTTQKVFERIRAVQPQKLYVSVDGPRQDKIGEKEQCDEVKRLVQVIDWPCQSFFLFNENNLGAEVSVSSAVSWVLKNEVFVIVLEDDIIAPETFFFFQQEMLLKYIDEPGIAMVSGCNYTPVKLPNDEDYLFGVYGHTWGWGTWQRAWKRFDLYVNDFDSHLKPKFLRQISNSPGEERYFKKLFKWMRKNGPGGNNWDYCWYYIRVTNDLLSIIPRVNLTSNIGIYGFHANGITENHFRKFDQDFTVLKHPIGIKKNIEYDKHHFKKHINKKPPLYFRAIKKIRRTISSMIMRAKR